MRFLPWVDMFGSSSNSDSNEDEAANSVPAGLVPPEEESHLLKTVGWISAALGAVALGLIVGREIRTRYKFNRRTPYDLYSHSGDEMQDVEFGVGI
jgi:hypothetical protein